MDKTIKEKTLVSGKEADQEKTDGKETISGEEDHYLMKGEALQVIVVIEILKTFNPNVQEIRCNFITKLSILKKLI